MIYDANTTGLKPGSHLVHPAYEPARYGMCEPLWVNSLCECQETWCMHRWAATHALDAATLGCPICRSTRTLRFTFGA